MKWKVQKENNRGFSLVAVITSVAIVSALVVMILTMTLMNYRMKLTNLNAQKTFYTAEEALDEISQGIARQLSISASEAYVYTMSNYNSLESDSRYTVFTGKLVDSMRSTLCAGTSGTTNYSIDYLESLLVKTGYDEETGIGAIVSSRANGNFLNATKDALVLKNVIVSYYGADDYLSEIQTDIVVSYPEIDFTQSSGTPNLLSYSLVADESFSVTGATGVKISGNAYLGSKGVTFTNSSVTFSQADDSDEQNALVTGSGISIAHGSTVFVDDLEVWANSILVDASTADISGSIYLSNDLVVDNTIDNSVSTSVKLTGAFYAYGNPDIIREASSMTGETDAIGSSPADYSSSVILNGSNSTVDLSGLNTMMIAGNSYIGATEYTDTITGMNSSDVLMGDSIAVKTEQTAYLIPAECVAPDDAYGGTNPMTVAQYEHLKKSLEEQGIEESGIVDYTKKISSLGVSLENLGVNKFQTAYYVVRDASGSTTEMVYLFMVFDSTNSAGNFASTYYNVAKNYNKLDSNLALYNNKILVPSALSGSESTVGSSFFLNGNLVSRGDSQSVVYLNSRLTGESTSEDYQTMAASVQEYRDIFSALQIKLTRKYYALTNEEKSNGVYDNLIYSMASVSKTSARIGSGNSNIFVSSDLTDDPIAAIVVNNGESGSPYVISADKVNSISGVDENGVAVSGARLCLVIASGDVKVAADFKGLIIAGGTITVEKGVTIAPDSTTVALAFTMKNQEGVSVSDYIIDADSYMIGGLSGSTGSSGGSIVYADLITYENWKKQ